MQRLDLDALLGHRIAVADRHGPVLQRLAVDRHAERRTDGILTAVTLADGVFLVVNDIVIVFQQVDDLLRHFGHAVLLHQRQHGYLDRSQCGREFQHDARIAAFERLLGIGRRHHLQEHAVHADRRLDHIGYIAFTRLRIEVLQLLARKLLVAAQVEVRARVDALDLLEPEREVVFDVRRGVGVVGQFVVVVEAVVIVAEAQRTVPGHAGVLPLVPPLHFGSGAHEELHLHLLELAHAEDELTGHDLVAEGLADLRNAERDFHAPGFLDVQEVDEDTLRRLGTQVDGIGAFGRRTHLGRKHQVELPHLGPVARAGDRAGDLAVDDDLAQLRKVVGVQRIGETLVHLVAFGRGLRHARRRFAVFGLVERLAEALAGLLDLFFDLFILFGQPVLDQHVGAVTLLRILVVDQRVVEGRHMARGLPRLGMHEDRGVDADDVLVQFDHRIPPISLDVVLQLHAVLTVVVHGSQTVVDFARRKHESVLLAVRYQLFEKFFLSHRILCCLLFFQMTKIQNK